MKIDHAQLMKLKGKVKSLEDLRSYALNLGLNFTEEELISVYDELNQDLDLENVTGGVEEYSARESIYMILGCAKCHKNMKVRTDGTSTRCPYCGTLTNKENGYYGC